VVVELPLRPRDGCGDRLYHGLVEGHPAGPSDELHLFVYPLALGSGIRLFPEHGATTKLALDSSVAYTSGVLHLTYGPV
jgi:dihydrofolate reductase